MPISHRAAPASAPSRKPLLLLALPLILLFCLCSTPAAAECIETSVQQSAITSAMDGAGTDDTARLTAALGAITSSGVSCVGAAGLEVILSKLSSRDAVCGMVREMVDGGLVQGYSCDNVHAVMKVGVDTYYSRLSRLMSLLRSPSTQACAAAGIVSILAELSTEQQKLAALSRFLGDGRVAAFTVAETVSIVSTIPTIDMGLRALNLVLEAGLSPVLATSLEVVNVMEVFKGDAGRASALTGLIAAHAMRGGMTGADVAYVLAGFHGDDARVTAVGEVVEAGLVQCLSPAALKAVIHKVAATTYKMVRITV